MTITATVIADSISEQDKRITTLQLRYPKFIHGEAKTHRLLRINNELVDVMQEVGFMDDENLSRNASSSRAIPVQRLIQDVMTDPAMPIHWGKNQMGMQAREEHDALVFCPVPMAYWGHEGKTVLESNKGRTPREAWLNARDLAVLTARAYDKAGYHKQIVNRILEPFCHINVVVTATEWDNFFALRCHPDAQPEMNALANCMRVAMEQSTPTELQPREWHLPYVTEEDREAAQELGYRAVGGKKVDLMGRGLNNAIKCSVARCARVSYLTHDHKKPVIEDDLKLYDRLASAVPMHASPMEHQATPDDRTLEEAMSRPSLNGNFVGWVQYRKMIEART